MKQALPLDIDRAIHLIATTLKSPRYESCSIDNALGRVTAEDIEAGFDFPQAQLSLVDGFCLAAGDTVTMSRGEIVELRIAGEIDVAQVPAIKIGQGECAAVSTGCILPRGANAVIRSEEVEVRDGKIAFSRIIRAAENVVERGGVLKAGDTVVQRGTFISGAVLGVLAGLGIKEIKVRQKPRIAIIATGEEFSAIGERDAKIFESNTYLLRGLLEPVCDVVRQLRVGSIGNDLNIALSSLSICDLVVLTGGTGLGSKDLIHDWLDACGSEIVFRGLNCAPGYHVTFARSDPFTFLCLPGKPLGCFILFTVLIRPALARLLDSPSLDVHRVRGRLQAEVQGKKGRKTWALGHLDCDLNVTPVVSSSGLDITAPMHCNCILEIPADRGILRDGESVDVLVPAAGFSCVL